MFTTSNPRPNRASPDHPGRPMPSAAVPQPFKLEQVREVFRWACGLVLPTMNLARRTSRAQPTVLNGPRA
eukprot:11400381-Alexandrium_andersonii.AAC.1